MKIEFSKSERRLVEEAFAQYLQIVTTIARLHDIEGEALGKVQVAPDRSGLVLPDAPEQQGKE